MQRKRETENGIKREKDREGSGTQRKKDRERE